jgi:serine/threonine protein kinase
MLGEIIKGQYQVVQIFRRSSYCQTYLAHDISQNQQTPCVIKHLLPASSQTASMSSLRRLFTREVAALEKLGTYSQVPQLLDYFEENQQFYLVQEYIAGQPLDAILLPGVRWNELQVIELLYEILNILEVVHAQGLIHRDIKPSNLICREKDGVLVLIDFGSVKQAWTQVVTSHGQTNANYCLGIPATVAIGTSGYMPSEQSRGRPRPNSDIYAVGMIGIQALTGMQPTQLLEDAETGEVIWQNLVEVSPELAAIINQMVRYQFSDRYQSTTQVLASLQPLVALLAPNKLKHSPIASEATNTSKPPDAAKTYQTAKTSNRANVPLYLGVTIGITTALGLFLGSYSALRRVTNIAPSIAQSQIALGSQNQIANVTLAHTLTGHTDAVWTVGISRDGHTLVSGSGDKTIKLWDMDTGHLVRTLSEDSAAILSVALSRDGQILTSGSYATEQAIKIWHLNTDKPRPTFGIASNVWSVALSPDGKTLASSSGDGSITIWNLQTGTLRRTLIGHSDTVWSVAISPDGQTLVSGSKDKTVKIWNLQTGALLRTLSGHSDRVRSVAISADGQTVASSSWDKTIKIWNRKTGKLLRTLIGHSGYVNSVAMSPDSRIIASGSDDETIKLWNLNTGELLGTLSGHSGNINCVDFNYDGRILVSSSEDKTIKIWQLQAVSLAANK